MAYYGENFAPPGKLRLHLYSQIPYMLRAKRTNGIVVATKSAEESLRDFVLARGVTIATKPA
jgi:hypothetical protein